MTHTSTPKRLRRWITRALLTIGVIVATTAVAVPPASAYVGTNFIRNWETGLCLTGFREYTLVVTAQCDFNNPYQQWTPQFVRHEQYDVVLLQNNRSGSCLTSEAFSLGQGKALLARPATRRKHNAYGTSAAPGQWPSSRIVPVIPVSTATTTAKCTSWAAMAAATRAGGLATN